jgi:hypothetical protein
MKILKCLRLLRVAGSGMSPSSSNDRIGACIRSYLVWAERTCDASADRLVTLS